MGDSPLMAGRMISIAEVADRLEVSTRTVRRLIAAGELPACHVGHQVRITEADYAAFVMRRRRMDRSSP